MMKKKQLMKKEDLIKLSEYVVNREKKESGFRKSIISMYEYNAKWSNIFFRFIVHIISYFLRPSAKSKKFIFWGTKFEELILSLPSEETCIVGGPKQLFFCLKHRRAFLPEMSLWHSLVVEIKGGLDSNNRKKVSSSIYSLSRSLRRITNKNTVLLVDNDSLPVQRAVIQAFRILDVGASICIQHGIFQRHSPGCILDGWFCDRFFVIDDNQKRLLIEKGMQAKKITVMGFYSTPYQPKRILSSPEHRKVCLIGQPWHKYGEEKGERYLKIFKEVTDILQGYGYSVSFKPHPWERSSSYLNNISGVENDSMKNVLEKYDVFISLTSTALLEAVASGRVAIQVVDPIFDADSFCDFSEVHSVSSESHDLSKSLLKYVKTEPAPMNSKIKPLAQRFYEALSG